MRTRRSAVVAATALLVLSVAGCGGDDGGASPSSASSGDAVSAPTGGGSVPLPSEVPTGTIDDDASDLAGLAEDLAKKQRIAPREGPVLGGDVSWPQCPQGLGIPEKRTLGLPAPLPSAEYVIVGLTNGPGFTPNPCLADQVALVKERKVLGAAYAVASYPDAETLSTFGGAGPFDGDTTSGALRNVGYSQARFNVDNLREAGLQTPIVWIDVEPVPQFDWSSDTEANAQVIVGAARGYEDAGYDVGVYSTPALWDGVVGDLTLDGVPEWRAAGETSQAEALNRCGDDWSIQGGPAILGQWVADNRDLNVTCPGVSADLAPYFHQY